MDKSWRQGEVTEVTVTLEPEHAVRLSNALFRLQVSAWSSFLHPAALQAALVAGHGCSYTLFRRYKDLSALHKQLKWLYTDLPTFPPKKWLIVNTENFLHKRAEQLNEYFLRLLDIGEMRRSQVLMEALRPPIILVLRVLGGNGAGKSTFVRRFLHYSPIVPEAPIRCSVALQPSRENGQTEWTLPVDMVVEGQVLRIVAIDLIVLSEDEGCPWILHNVKNKGLVLVAKAENSGEGQPFAERRWLPSDKAVDSELQGKEAYEAVCTLISDYLKLIAT